MAPPQLNFLTGCFGWQPMAMTRANLQTTKVWLLTVLMILTIPSSLAAFGTRKDYLLIKRYPELSKYPYNPKMELAFYLTYIGNVIAFPWTFVAFLLLCKWSGNWIAFHGIVNLALTIITALGVSMQAEFLPGSGSGCQERKAFGWQVVEDYPSVFERIAVLDKNDWNRTEAVCKKLVTRWTTAKVALFFQSLLAYVSVFFDERELSLLNPMRPPVYTMIIIFVPIILFKDLILPRIRLGLSFLKKGLAIMRSTEDLQIPLQTQFRPQYQHIDTPGTKLTEVLVIEHVLLNVVDYLHFEDVVNLSLACRAMRQVVYPLKDLEYRVPKLNKHCCSIGWASKCVYCNNKVCDTCKRNPLWPGLPGHRHATSCIPFCKSCYFKSFSEHPQGYKRPCRCNRAERQLEVQDVCRSCMEKDQESLQTGRHRRYEQQARDVAYQEDSRCGLCAKVLGDGLRWWKCGKCEGECRDRIHPAVVNKKKRRERDVEKQDDRPAEHSNWWRRWRDV